MTDATRSHLSPADAAFLRRAIVLACVSAGTAGGPFGAVVVQDGRVVAECTNRVVPDCDPTAHAELLALREAGQALGTHDLSGCVVYASCEPCPMCAAALHWARVERVIYAAGRDEAAAAGFDDERLFAELRRDPAARTVPAVQALAEEGRAAFDAWRNNPDRVAY